MRFLMVGAGAVGGYFGGRLVEKGEDVTFLVRQKRKEQLHKNGLTIKSVNGDFHTNEVKAISAGEEVEAYDVIVLTVKAYHLETVISEITPYVGDETVIIPLLNGYSHYQVLQETFGNEKVLGGLCFIESTLNEQGEIVQTSGVHDLVFGEWSGTRTSRVKAIFDHMNDAGFKTVLSEMIRGDVWNKYIFIASMSGVTTLMRSPIGPIMENEHGKFICQSLVNEIVSIVKDYDDIVNESAADVIFNRICSLAPQMKSSMQRDMEKNALVEADHFHGVLLKIAEEQGKDLSLFPALRTVYSNLKVYESLL